MIFDIKRRYPRGYHHRHKLHIRPEGFGAEGPAEMYFLIHDIMSKVSGRSEDQATFDMTTATGATATHINKVIYDKPPHGCADNHFSGENVCKLAGELGMGLTLTCRRDRFPKGLKPYLHHEKTVPGDPRAKAARFEKPIIAINQVQATETTKAYTRTQVSFQSTGATNIQGVNNLPSCSLYVTRALLGH